MNKVRTWLAAIGLTQYADAFETNDIEMDLLGQLDDQMLKDIGVASAGHRLRIHNAVAKLAARSNGMMPPPLRDDPRALDHVTVVHRPRLLSDNGSSYVAGDLARWLQDKGMEHVRGAPYHPQTRSSAGTRL